MLKPNKKIVNTCIDYLRAHAQYSVWDSSEGMHDQETYEHTYDVLVEDTEWEGLDIQKFIRTYLPEEITKIKQECEDEGGEIVDWDDIATEFMGRE